MSAIGDRFARVLAGQWLADRCRKLRLLLACSRFVLRAKRVQCPVCTHEVASVLRYGPFLDVFDGPSQALPEIRTGHEKYVCRECGHCFTTWFPALDEFSVLYSNLENDDQRLVPNSRCNAQREMIRRLIARRGPDGRYLDFGCGRNFSICHDMRRDGLDVCACDIHRSYPYDGEVFFRYDPARPDVSRFDGISSMDAIEHIQNIASVWRYFNRALKPGGFMVHSFPSVFRYGYGHLFCRIPVHACLFSRRSLQIWSDKMGFSYLGSEPLPDCDVGECYWFRKIREVQ